MPKELLFSVTKEDCDWFVSRGTGPGGQKRNKTETKVRCVHRASGAAGESDETRDQHKNRKLAFIKMANTKEFKAWHKMEVARRIGDEIALDEYVESAMMEHNLKVEGKLNGKWVPIEQAHQDE